MAMLMIPMMFIPMACLKVCGKNCCRKKKKKVPANYAELDYGSEEEEKEFEMM